jgi:hypothetical protein
MAVRTLKLNTQRPFAGDHERASDELENRTNESRN